MAISTHLSVKVNGLSATIRRHRLDFIQDGGVCKPWRLAEQYSHYEGYKEAMLRLVGGVMTQNRQVSHPECVVTPHTSLWKSPLRRGPSPTPGSQTHSIMPGRGVPITSDCRPVGNASEWDGLLESQHSSWRAMHGFATSQTHKLFAPVWGDNSKRPGTYREEPNCLASEPGLEGQGSGRLSPETFKPAGAISPLLIPPRFHRQVWNLCSLPTWLILFALPWWFPEIPPHPNCVPAWSVLRSFSTQTACLGSHCRLS